MENDDLIFDSDLCGLPAFDSSGKLPSGVHDCSFNCLAESVCFNEHRLAMWRQLVNFLALPVLGHAFSNVYLGGEFMSSKAEPGVIDILLETADPLGPVSLAAIRPYFVVDIDRVEMIFGINLHFRMVGSPDKLFGGPFSAVRQGAGEFPFASFPPGLARLHLNGADMLITISNLIRRN